MGAWTVLAFFGFGLLLNGAHSQIKSPHKQDEGVEVNADNVNSELQELDELRRNVYEISQSINDYQSMMERGFHNLYTFLDSLHSDNIHNTGNFRHIQLSVKIYPDSAKCQEIPEISPPRFRNPEDFDFAVCNVQPNLKTSSKVRGRVLFVQKKNSPTLNMYIVLRGFDYTAPPSQPRGNIPLYHPGVGPEMPPLPRSQLPTRFHRQHGFHVHERADFSDGCDSTGGDFNPFNAKHGAPEYVARHLGDFGNIESDRDGNIFMTITDEKASLRGRYNIVGKALVVHADVDDLGRHTDNFGSTTTGNAGARLGCCLIEKIPSSLYNNYHYASEQTERHTSNDQQASYATELIQ